MTYYIRVCSGNETKGAAWWHNYDCNYNYSRDDQRITITNRNDKCDTMPFCMMNDLSLIYNSNSDCSYETLKLLILFPYLKDVVDLI